MKKYPIYVLGHKNPDSDSIVSAIAYAELLKKQGKNAIAARIGSTNNETEYLLDRFGFEDPIRLYSARSSLLEIDMDKPSLVSKDLTMKEALDLCLKQKSKNLIVADKSKHLEGIISLDDLTYMWTKTDKQLESIIKKIEIDNVVKILEGKLIIRGSRALGGKLHIFPTLKSRVELDSIVVTRNEDDKMKYCLGLGATMLIVVTSSPISKTILQLAKDTDTTIITTAITPLSATRLIYQIPTIEHVMQKANKVEYFNANNTVQEANKKIANSRHRSYPVINGEGKVVGAVTRYHLSNYKKKQLILVDHNEFKQSIDEIEDGEILEIIDHHRFGGFESDNPINITTLSVGSTATIIANKYFESGIKLDKKLAGLLLGALVSDTMNLKSPTTTNLDIEILKKLEKISGVNADELSKEMIKHTDSLLSKRFIQIVYDDFKEFNFDGIKVGLSQSLCKSSEEFEIIKNDLQQYINDSSKTGSYDLIVIMLTNPNGSGSYVLAGGEKAYLLNEMFAKNINNNFVNGLVSRKKQLLPKVIKCLEA
ncbi:MAG: putative manganese-dependent inorganic diphosphatase [Firmicutes bacterium]|nr:putative manganese-dependent inorganic diphosphatase [Candidatus Colivicinus equi]